MSTKTLKIPEAVHKELKIYVAQNENANMTDFAGVAILVALKANGHKFVVKPKGKKK